MKATRLLRRMPKATSDRPLTDRQLEVLELWVSYLQAEGRAPSFREIMEAMGWNSPNAVYCHVFPLVAKGWLEHPGETMARGWRLTERAVSRLRQVRAEPGQVIFEALTPRVKLSPESARELAAALVRAADEAESIGDRS